MEDSKLTKSSLSVPFAIVIAGALIAVAVFFSKESGTLSPASSNQQNTAQPSAVKTESAISIRAISDSDHVLGNPAAPLAIIVYTDLECPYCKAFHATMNQVSDTYGKNGNVLWVYRHFPLVELHSKAPAEAVAAECAVALGGETAFWDFIGELFKVTPSNNGLDLAELPNIASRIGLSAKQVGTFNDCLSNNTYAQKVTADHDDAVKAGGLGTPFSVFVSGKTLSGTTITAIQNINNEFLTQGSPEGPLAISTDKKRVSMSGALPFIYVQRIIDALLNK